MRLISLAFVLMLSSIAAAQTIQPSITKDDGQLVTVKLALDNPDADFKPAECFWYSFRVQTMYIIHEGCSSFTREFSEGQHLIILILNGHSSKLTGNDQRTDVVALTVEPRLKTEHMKYRPEDLAAMESRLQKK